MVRVIRKSLPYHVRNVTRDTILGDAVVLADTAEARRTGLLKHNSLEPGSGLWIVPCEAVHTFFMHFPIDLVYVDRKRYVRKVLNSLAPWRMSACLSAHSVIELPAGVVQQSGTRKGDQLELRKVKIAA